MKREITTTVVNGKKKNVFIRRETCRKFGKILDDFQGPIIVYDLETTGLSKISDRIVQLAAIKLERDNDGKYQITKQMNQYLNPGFPMPEKASRVNRITDEILKGKPDEDAFFPVIEEFFSGVNEGKCVVCGYNIKTFDNRMMDCLYKRQGRDGFLPEYSIDVMDISMEILDRRFLRDESFKQENVAEYLGFLQETMHDALTDVTVSGRILWHLYGYYHQYLELLPEEWQGYPKATILGMYELKKSKTVNYILIQLTAQVNGEVRMGQFHYDLYNKRYVEDSGNLMREIDMLDFSYAADRYAGGEIKKYHTNKKKTQTT